MVGESQKKTVAVRPQVLLILLGSEKQLNMMVRMHCNVAMLATTLLVHALVRGLRAVIDV